MDGLDDASGGSAVSNLWAYVTSTSPFKVRVSGAATDTVALKLPSYSSPAVNDRVAYLLVEGQLVVLGKPA